MHYGVRGPSLPDGHLFLILVPCLKPHTGSLLKELDNRVLYIGYLESARCHARCCPGACTSEPQNHLWRQIVFSPLFLGGNRSSGKLGNLPGWLCWNLNPPLSDPPICLSHREAQGPQKAPINLSRQKKDHSCCCATEVPVDVPDAELTPTSQPATLRELAV